MAEGLDDEARGTRGASSDEPLDGPGGESSANVRRGPAMEAPHAAVSASRRRDSGDFSELGALLGDHFDAATGHAPGRPAVRHPRSRAAPPPRPAAPTRRLLAPRPSLPAGVSNWPPLSRSSGRRSSAGRGPSTATRCACARAG